MEHELKNIGGQITSFKQLDRGGIPVGIVEGYIATWDVDRGNDQFRPGAFQEHLAELRQQNRAIRLKDMHGRAVGIFPIENVKEDSRGLFGIGEINLEVQQGKELYSLVKQGAMTDFSIGFTAKEVEFENGIRIIMKSKVWEGSVVDEPMNPYANITDVKTVNSRANLPKEYAPQTMKWDSTAAEKRVRAWANAEEDGPNTKYKKAFLWWDSENEELFTSYKLGVADIVDGSLKLVPRAIFAVRAVLSGARGGVDIPQADQAKVKNLINILYKEMELEPPFGQNNKVSPVCKTELKSLTKSDFCFTIQNCKLSRDAADYITSLAYPTIMEELSNGNGAEVLNDLIKDLKSFKETLHERRN